MNSIIYDSEEEEDEVPTLYLEIDDDEEDEPRFLKSFTNLIALSNCETNTNYSSSNNEKPTQNKTESVMSLF